MSMELWQSLVIVSTVSIAFAMGFYQARLKYKSREK